MDAIITIKLYFQVLLVLSIYTWLSSSAYLYNRQRYRRSPQVVSVSGLYNGSDEVEELTANNFNQKIYGSKKAWLVEFYNTYCGHCQRYAPTYRAVGGFFNSTKDIFVVAAIDCANEINQPLCRNFEIMAFPTLKYFHENYVEGPKNLGMTINKAGVDDVNANIRSIIDTLIDEQKQNRGHMLPNLLPYEHSNISRVFSSVGPKVKIAFLVLENETSFFGVGAALVFHRVPNIYITYSLKSNTNLTNSLGVTELPALVVMSHNRGEPLVEEKHTNIESAQKLIEASLKQKGIDFSQYLLNSKIDVNHKEKPSIEEEKQKESLKLKNMGDAVFQMDLETTLRFSLRQEVGRSKIIEGEKLGALRDYLKVVVKYFPLGKKGHLFLNELNKMVTNSISVKGADISSLVKNSEREDQLIWSSPKDWLGCKGSIPGSRGYPCGLWTMFHYILVNAAEQNVGSLDTDPKEVLMAMHGYIKHFFGCADCSQHFQQMSADRHIERVSSLSEAIMWLWSAHNEVNDRLAGDPTEDPEYPKRQFPIVERCPECRFRNGSWDEKQVEKYLKHMYANNNIRYIGADMRVFHLDIENSNGVLSSIDSICRWVLLLPIYLGYVHSRQ